MEGMRVLMAACHAAGEMLLCGNYINSYRVVRTFYDIKLLGLLSE